MSDTVLVLALRYNVFRDYFFELHTQNDIAVVMGPRGAKAGKTLFVFINNINSIMGIPRGSRVLVLPGYKDSREAREIYDYLVGKGCQFVKIEDVLTVAPGKFPVDVKPKVTGVMFNFSNLLTVYNIQPGSSKESIILQHISELAFCASVDINQAYYQPQRQEPGAIARELDHFAEKVCAVFFRVSKF